MIYLEACLIAILAVLFLNTSITDLKHGIVSNRSILAALGAGVVIAAAYYGFFAADCLVPYAMNILIGLVISIALYAFGIWGAGDSKLLVTTILIFPARLYCLGNRSVASCFLLIAIVFVIAFIYIVGDTVYYGIRQRDLFRLRTHKISWLGYARGFLFFFFLLSLFNVLLTKVLPGGLLMDTVLMTAISFIVILIGMKLEAKANWIVVAAMGILWGLMLLLGVSEFRLGQINWISYLVVVVLMLFRMTADKYNYMTIPVSELRPGMILSMGSILRFASSDVSGLPTYSSEDLKSRLSREEVESIVRWSETADAEDGITIVRKIPFALFIGIGTVIFTVLEVMTG